MCERGRERMASMEGNMELEVEQLIAKSHGKLLLKPKLKRRKPE